jgi:hypothetical protein
VGVVGGISRGGGRHQLGWWGASIGMVGGRHPHNQRNGSSTAEWELYSEMGALQRNGSSTAEWELYSGMGALHEDAAA